MISETAAPLLRGVAIGAFAVVGFSVWRSALGRDAKLTTVLTCLSAAAWTLTGSGRAPITSDGSDVLLWLTFPAAGFFWAFVVCVFQDRPLRGLVFAPAALLLGLGVATSLAPGEMRPAMLAGFNLVAAGLCLHAVYLILRSWRGDLVESRRSSRIVILGIAALFASVEGAGGAFHWLGLSGAWIQFATGEDLVAVAMAGLGLALGGLLLQARGAIFATPDLPTEAVDPRLAAAERVLLAKLRAFMSDGAWRREGLSIGAVARELGTQEHRLRRLINSRLQHRNFADFVNGYRIEAAKARLADATQAEATVASIAFDLGFGSLNPFNRAFRAATGVTPTAWRRAALAGSDAAKDD